MSAQIPDTMPISDLLKSTGYDCPERLQGKTFEESTTGGGNISIEANKKVSITTNGIVEITPTEGKDGMKKVTANVNVGGSGSGVKFVVSKSYSPDTSNNSSFSPFLQLQSLKADNIHDGDTITTMLNYDYGAGTYNNRELILLTVGEVPLYKVPNSPINGDTRDALFIGNPYLAGIEGWEDNGCPIFTVWYADNDGGYTYNYVPDYPNYGSAEVGNMGNYRGRIKIGDSIKICTSDLSILADTLEDISGENYLRAQRQLFIKG